MLFRLITAGLVSAGLAASALAQPEAPEPKKGATPNMSFAAGKSPSLKVATYNMAATRVSNIDAVAKAVKALGADLIALNEVDNKTQRTGGIDQVSALMKATGMEGVFGKAIDFDRGEYGVAILSKFPIKRWHTYKLPSGGEEQRVLLVAEIMKPGFPEPILFMATHLDWHLDPTIRTRQAQEINNIALGNTKGPFEETASRIKILAGDMNAGADGKTLAEFQKIWSLVNKPGADTRSWPAINPVRDLDHILTFKGQKWALSHFEIPNASATWDGIDWPKVSDHVPVVVQIDLLEQ